MTKNSNEGEFKLFVRKCPACLINHTTGRISNVTDTFTIIVANREWVGSHANASRLWSSVALHGNESLCNCTISKEKTRRALKMLRFFHHFSTRSTYLPDNRERERDPIVSVGVDPTGTFWSRLATFDVYDQITIATRRQTWICPSCESPITFESQLKLTSAGKTGTHTP